MLLNYGRGMKKRNTPKIIQFQVVRDVVGSDIFVLYSDGTLYRVAWEDGSYKQYRIWPIEMGD